MKKVFLLNLLLFFFLLSLFSQSPAKYWVQFKDKASTEYNITEPEKFLSQRAVEKRKKYNIPVTVEDIPVSDFYIGEILKLDTGMRLFTKTKWLNGITVYSQKDSIDKEIIRLPFVLVCEKTITMKEPEEITKDTFLYVNPENSVVSKMMPLKMDLEYGKSLTQIRMNNIHWLHRMGYLGNGVVLAVMDGGFKNVDKIKHFNLLRSENRLLGVKNFVQPNVNPFLKEGHGTMVLSCIASDLPGEMVGTAPKVLVYLAKTEDGRSENKIEEDNWVAGIEWADSLGCDILNSSLGYTKFDDSTQLRTYQDLNGNASRASKAATIAASKGMLICNSAGNEGARKWKYIGSPADAKDILTVGAVDMKGKKARFSSFGPTADGRIKPDACAVGEATFVGTPAGLTWVSSGTSFSSPLIAGMLACLRQAFPEKSNYEIMDAVRQSGHQFTSPDSALGYGITDFLKAYNLLLQEHTITDRNGNKIFETTFDTYVGQNNKLSVKIFSKDEQIITITTLLEGTLKPLIKEYKLKQGMNIVEVHLPKLTKSMLYGLNNLTILGEEVSQQFIIGSEYVEKEKKK